MRYTGVPLLYLLHPLYIRGTQGTSRIWRVEVQVLQEVQEGYEGTV